MKKYKNSPERWSYRIRQGEKVLATNLFREDVIVHLNKKEDDEILSSVVERLNPSSNTWETIPVQLHKVFFSGNLTYKRVGLGDPQ